MNTLELLHIPTPVPNAVLRLICFSYAGGSSATYLSWKNHLDSQVELVVCQLPGRGSRLFEEPYEDMQLLVNDLCIAMKALCDKPFIFFGHSLGSKLAYELCLVMQQQNLPLPVQFIASAASAPFYRRNREPIHALPDDEFIDSLAKLNGTLPQVLNNPEIMELYLPALRADFKIVENYINQNKTVLATQLTLFGGVRDVVVAPSELVGWKKLFEKTVSVEWFEGDHFFINQSYNPLKCLNHILTKEIKKQASKKYELNDDGYFFAAEQMV